MDSGVYYSQFPRLVPWYVAKRAARKWAEADIFTQQRRVACDALRHLCATEDGETISIPARGSPIGKGWMASMRKWSEENPNATVEEFREECIRIGVPKFRTSDYVYKIKKRREAGGA